jgi:DNA-binding NarL/FixJ family response regulator
MAIRIALVDDNRVNLNTFARKIQASGDLDLCFMATGGNECLELLKDLPPGRHPQVLFVDIEMPVLDGIEFIRIAKVLYPQIFYIVLTVFDDDEKLFEAIRAGANGYLLKDDTAMSLRNAITIALEDGGAPMSPPIARKALELLSNSTLNQSALPDKKESALDTLLSEREKEILQCTVKGLTPKQIADTLFISIFTVRKHIAHIYEKLHVSNAKQVMSLAYKNGWVK